MNGNLNNAMFLKTSLKSYLTNTLQFSCSHSLRAAGCGLVARQLTSLLQGARSTPRLYLGLLITKASLLECATVECATVCLPESLTCDSISNNVIPTASLLAQKRAKNKRKSKLADQRSPNPVERYWSQTDPVSLVFRRRVLTLPEM